MGMEGTCIVVAFVGVGFELTVVVLLAMTVVVVWIEVAADNI